MQNSVKSPPAKKIISASVPKDISAVDKAALEKKWNDAAKKREENIARETMTPTEPSLTLKYQLKKFGRHWNAYAADAKGKMIPLLNAPSILNSAIDALSDRMSEEALKA